MGAGNPREARIAELEAQVAARDTRIAELLAKVEALSLREEELEARLGQNSTNSSKPPSLDPPGVKRKKKPPTGRRPGGQRGHKRHKRELLPPEQVDRFIDLQPGRQCEHCQQKLVGEPGPVLRHQTVEVRPLKAVVTEYRCPALTCAHCGTLNRAELPPEAAGHVFGERLSAIVCLLVGKYRLSKRLVQEALSDLLGVRLSLGAVSNREQEMSEALCAPIEQAQEYVRNQDSVHMDETGWVEGKARRAWLWVVSTALVWRWRGGHVNGWGHLGQ